MAVAVAETDLVHNVVVQDFVVDHVAIVMDADVHLDQD
jgi:hypothetical protein